MTSKNLKLIIAVCIIGLIIFYIEAKKTPVPAPSQIEQIPVVNPQSDRRDIIQAKAKKYSPAIELVPGGEFINSESFTLKSLIGKKVILVDFWTYSCINCLRTLPYLKSWYAKYKDQGLEIIGVHTPEFDFEKDYGNLLKAVKDLGINYPVMQDNDYATWSAYSNRYWPREYLIDIDGFIVHDHAGEGEYDVTETAIQNALRERAEVLNMQVPKNMNITNPADAYNVTPTEVASPETYFGSGRNEFLGNGNPGIAGIQKLEIPASRELNSLYLGGIWNFQEQFASNDNAGAEIDYKYNAKDVYFVASSESGIKVKVFLDGQLIRSAMAGEDVLADGTVLIQDNRLYKIVRGLDYGQHELKLIIQNRGLNAFTFTFG